MVFGGFCVDNVCTCVVRALILLPVTNMSPGIYAVTLISYKMQTFHL